MVVRTEQTKRLGALWTPMIETGLGNFLPARLGIIKYNTVENLSDVLYRNSTPNGGLLE